MIISFQRKTTADHTVEHPGLDIEMVSKHKYLGDHLNSKLDWNPAHHRLQKQEHPIMCEVMLLDELSTFYALFNLLKKKTQL